MNYAAFWAQIVRWSMRPVDNRNLTLNVRREDGKIKVVVDALDKDSRFLNFLQLRGGPCSAPTSSRSRVDLVQTAPGRYEGTVESAEASGNYFVNLGFSGPDNIKGVVSTGVSVPYSDEYRELKSNPGTLETIASLTNGEVLSWKRRNDGTIDLARTLDESKPFRRDQYTQTPRGLSPLWPLLLFFAATMFLGDVAIRRVSPDFERMLEAGQGPVGEAPRPRGRPAGRVHGEAQGPQGRGQRPDRTLPSRHPLRGPAGPSDAPVSSNVDEFLQGGTAHRPTRRTSAAAPGPRPGRRGARLARGRELYEPAAQGQEQGLGGSREGRQGQGQAMMRRRLSLAMLMGLVGLVALGLAAMKVATAPAALLSVFAASAALLIGTLGIILRRRGGAWVGFALFGWSYAAAGLGFEPLRSVATDLVDLTVAALHPEPTLVPSPPVEGVDTNFIAHEGRYYRLENGAWVDAHLSPEEAKAVDAYFGARDRHQGWSSSVEEAQRIGLMFLGLAFASIGALAGHFLDDRSTPAGASSDAPTPNLTG